MMKFILEHSTSKSASYDSICNESNDIMNAETQNESHESEIYTFGVNEDDIVYTLVNFIVPFKNSV